MVDYKSKYLEMKLKYINAKNKFKGGMNVTEEAASNPRRALRFHMLPRALQEFTQEIIEEDKKAEEAKIGLIKDFIEITWYGNNYNIPMEFKKDVEEINEKIKSWYAQSTYLGPGYSLNSSKIKENSEELDFNLLQDLVEGMKQKGVSKNEYVIWDGIFNDQ